MNKDHVFWGVCFILGAVLLITNQIWGGLGISLFKVFVTVLCVAIIIKSISHLNFWGILLPMALLYSIYDNPMHFFISRGTVWGAAVLGCIGLELLFKEQKRNMHNETYTHTFNQSSDSSNIAGERIKLENTFGNSTKYVSSDNFLYAKIDNSFGSLAVYFDNALIQNGNAEIYLDNVFGVINIYLPKNWYVDNQVRVTFGAFKENGQNQVSNFPVVNITGSTTFGTVNVYYI